MIARRYALLLIALGALLLVSCVVSLGFGPARVHGQGGDEFAAAAGHDNPYFRALVQETANQLCTLVSRDAAADAQACDETRADPDERDDRTAPAWSGG